MSDQGVWSARPQVSRQRARRISRFRHAEIDDRKCATRLGQEISDSAHQHELNLMPKHGERSSKVNADTLGPAAAKIG